MLISCWLRACCVLHSPSLAAGSRHILLAEHYSSWPPQRQHMRPPTLYHSVVNGSLVLLAYCIRPVSLTPNPSPHPNKYTQRLACESCRAA